MRWCWIFAFGLLVAVLCGMFFSNSGERVVEDAQQVSRDGKTPLWGMAKLQGRRAYMEDTSSFLIGDTVYMFGVYDGHGNDRVSLYLQDVLLPEISKHFTQQESQNRSQAMYETLFSTFRDVNEQYKSLAKEKWKNWGSGGSTAVVGAIYQETDGTFHLAVANTGDSRGVYCCKGDDGKVYPMSYDHKPNSPSEKARIEDSGGFIAKAARGPWRVNGILATSRSFGDFDLSPQVIADPEIIDIELGRVIQENNKFRFKASESWSVTGANLLLASDGLWDVFSNQEAAKYVEILRAEGKTPEEIADLLVVTSYERYSGDNITALVVFIDKLLESIAQS